jgi:hypothetical protein
MQEKDPERKKILQALSISGAAVSAYLLVCLLVFNATVETSEHHVYYLLPYPHTLRWLTSTLYFSATVISPFVSSLKKARLIALLLLASFLLAILFFHDYLISTWCFFAAAVSITIYVEMKSEKPPGKE